jgi:hypothetical protein
VGNGLVKIFHAPLRDGLLDREARFEGPIVIETWRRQYNIVRSLASFGYRPPAPELFVAAFPACAPFGCIGCAAPPIIVTREKLQRGCRLHKL